MSIRGKLISEISLADIFELVKERTREDAFLEFKKEVLDPRKPPRKLNEERGDLVADLVSFANAQGGYLLVGVETDPQERAAGVAPMDGHQAKEVAKTLRDLASVASLRQSCTHVLDYCSQVPDLSNNLLLRSTEQPLYLVVDHLSLAVSYSHREPGLVIVC